MLQVASYSLTSSCPLTVSSNAGNGGVVTYSNVAHGGGGGGGEGVVVYAISQPTTNVTTATSVGTGGASCQQCAAAANGQNGGGANNAGILSFGAATTPLPIELLDFTATVITHGEVKLDWETATQTNNNYFTLEKSKDAANWTELIRVKGAGTTTSYMAYTELDAKPYTGTSYYRLKQTDFNGAFTYSKIRAVNMDETNSVKMYPNPAQTQITIEGDAEELEAVNVYNLLGQNMGDRIKISRPGETKAVIDLSSLSKGVYYIKTSSTAKEVFVQ